jgi:uncharacterized protein (TIGR03086 family)
MTDRQPTPDLGSTAAVVKTVISGVRDEQLPDPTPCDDTPVAQMLDHFMGLTVAFRLAAQKATGGFTARAPVASAEHLDTDWRRKLPDQLDALVAAWRDPAAWEGDSQVGGVDLPGAVIGHVALSELVVHGWDLARGTGQAYELDDDPLEACLRHLPEKQTGDIPGLYKAEVPVPPDAPLLDRVVAKTGRHPDWKP